VFFIFLVDGGPSHDALGYSNGSVFNLIFFSKKNVAYSGYGTETVPEKFVTGTKNGTMVQQYISATEFESTWRVPLLCFFLFLSSLCEMLHYLDPFCVVTAPKISDRGGGSGEWKAGMVKGGECGRNRDGMAG
jgi:hypothetical protein